MSTDILSKIKVDFSKDTDLVINLINKALEETEYLRNERIIRCIIFLGDKNIHGLEKSINDAKNDPRDVMYWAEYTNRKSLTDSKRIRDFSKLFKENNLTIKS